MCNSTSCLTEKQIAFFRKNGYLVVKNVLAIDDISRLRNLYDRLFLLGGSIKNGDFFNLCGVDVEQGDNRVLQLMNCSRYSPGILKGVIFYKCLNLARQLLGETCQFKQDFAICKPAFSKGITPWHQDNSYLSCSYDYNSINIWIPLQPTDPNNGCMKFIPSEISMQEILPHYRINNDPRIEGLQCNVDETQAVFCPLDMGDITIHYVRTLHSTGPNNTRSPRRALILEFETPPKKRDVPHHFSWLEERKTKRIAEYRSVSARIRNAVYRISQKISHLVK